MANQSILFPDPATEFKIDQELTLGKGTEQPTLSVYPQEGVGRFPLIEYTALKKPLSCIVMTSFACDVMIDGWIRRREPSEKTISELIPCESV